MNFSWQRRPVAARVFGFYLGIEAVVFILYYQNLQPEGALLSLFFVILVFAFASMMTLPSEHDTEDDSASKYESGTIASGTFVVVSLIPLLLCLRAEASLNVPTVGMAWIGTLFAIVIGISYVVRLSNLAEGAGKGGRNFWRGLFFLAPVAMVMSAHYGQAAFLTAVLVLQLTAFLFIATDLKFGRAPKVCAPTA